MISDQEFLHGAAFLRLINLGQPVTITHVPHIHSSIYVVRSHVRVAGVLFKVSTKSRSAWPFIFTAQENTAITMLNVKYPEIEFFVALVCQKDGVCCLSERQLKEIFGSQCPTFTGQRVSVSRKPNGSYHISGANKVSLEKTVPQNAWPQIIFQHHE